MAQAKTQAKTIKVQCPTDVLYSEEGGTEVRYGIEFKHVVKGKVHSLVADVDVGLAQPLVDADKLVAV